MAEYNDKWLACSECGQQFLWDAGEQHWYLLMQLFNAPKRCKKCRDKLRDEQKNQPCPITSTQCERCGDATVVPFVPRGIKPVYCRRCMVSLHATA